MRNIAVFGKRTEPHMVIIARGDRIRHFTVRPWMAALAGSALAAVAIGYLAATTYLVLRDDLIGASVAHQARMQQAYEDRIAALRSQVDRITSRQLLDQQMMERKVGELMLRQEELTQRHGRLTPAVEAVTTQDAPPPVAPIPKKRPEIRAEAVDGAPFFANALGYAAAPAALRGAQAEGTSADKADKVFVAINRSLRAIEVEQVERLRTLTEGAQRTADRIASALSSTGLSIDLPDNDAAGGPLLAPIPAASFEQEVRELDEALSRLDEIKSTVRRLPIANPAPGHAVSSRFGMRRDPILGVRAMHSGMDFRAKRGTQVRATASGTVIHAGWNGGYGRMVEVEHDDGYTTRYAHLSKVTVREGDRVMAGDVVGKVGSSGRSTGPHLHYEVRKSGKPLDPVRFIEAGRKVSRYL